MGLVVIAEDEAALLESFSEVLVGMGHRALRAQDGEEAVMLARTHRPDLIVSDHMMPRRTGMEVVRTAREDPLLAKTPVILMSAARPRGAEGLRFLEKPVRLADFENAVREALDGAPVRSPADGGVEVREPTPSSSSRDESIRDEMLNWVAHEIKTPLSAARMAAEMLLRKPGAAADEADARRVKMIVRQLDQMDALVNAVLEAARLDDARVKLRRKPLDLVSFAEEVVADWRELEPSVTFELKVPSRPVTVSCDVDRLRQILNNLLSNSVKYGGTARRTEVELREDSLSASIRVTDHGVGIAASELPHVFDRFHRAEGVRGRGHGLGLYIANGLARLHGGTLKVSSTFGEGSSFLLVLPLSR